VSLNAPYLCGRNVLKGKGDDQEVGDGEQEGGQEGLVQVDGQHGEREEDQRHAGGHRVVRRQRHQHGQRHEGQHDHVRGGHQVQLVERRLREHRQQRQVHQQTENQGAASKKTRP